MSTEKGSEQVYSRRWWALAVLSLSLVVIGMDNTILNVAIPTLVRELEATSSQLQWMIDSYVVIFAGLLLLMGALSDRFGRKLILNLGLLVFVAGSVASAWAGSADALIFTRGLMGIGAAMIFPSTLSIITHTFPPAERGRAIAAWAAMAGVGVLLGPVVGGWLLGEFWWGSVFLINVPIVATALLAGWPLVPESQDPEATPLDPVGALLSIAGLVALVFAIIEVPDQGWTDPSTLWTLAAAVVLLGVFIWWEIRAAHPMLRMEFFRNPRFSAASVAITLAFFAMIGMLFALTQYLQFVLDYTPLQAGYRILPIATLIVGAPVAARLVEKIGTKVVVAAGLVVTAIGLWMMSGIEIADGYTPLGWALATLGVGLGMTMAPATDSIMGSVPTAKAGVGSAMNDTTRQVGGALGVAVLGSVLSSSYREAIAPALTALPGQVADAARESIGAALAVAGQIGAEAAPLAEAARSAFTDAMGTTALLAAGVALAGAIIVSIFLPARESTEPEAASDDEMPVD